MAQNSKRRLELKVVLDTNALFTKSESYLLNHSIAVLIAENSAHDDLHISWYVPGVVLEERRFQMRKRALELLPAIEKLELLLGHNLNITAEVLDERVDSAIQKQVQSLALNVIELNTEGVEWAKLIDDSTYRRPPFDSGDSEKGFRDAIVLESFLQLVRDSPTTPSICRVALLSGDKLVQEAAHNRVSQNNAKNLSVLNSIEDLTSMINVLSSKVNEEFVESIKARANAHFFEKGQEKSLYYKEDVRKTIESKFGKILKTPLEPTHSRARTIWKVGSPSFLRKDGQRIFWSSHISIESEIRKSESSTGSQLYSGAEKGSLYRLLELGQGLDWSSALDVGTATQDTDEVAKDTDEVAKSLTDYWHQVGKERTLVNYILKAPPDIAAKRLVGTERIGFDVVWSISVSTKRHSFSKAKIEDIKFTGRQVTSA